MKNLIGLLIIVILICGCNDSTKPDENPMVTIEISQNSLIQETFIITENEDGDIYPIYFEEQQIGELEIFISEFISDPPNGERIIAFHTIARKNNNYTNFAVVNHFDTFSIDYQQDFDIVNENLNCGTMYDPADGLILNSHFSVWTDSVFIDSLFTDNLGRFEIELESDNYIIRSGFGTCGFELQLVEGYSDYSYPNYFSYDWKPNIYIYPMKEIDLDVSITFPHSGEVIKSIPEYPNQWQDLQIKPDGKINDEYNYLFYESIQPNFFQKTKGWVVKCENLKDFFNNNLQLSGYNQNEINDFIEHWIPRLVDSEYYAIYPQYNKQLDQLIQLNFSKQPDNILRLTYYIVKLHSNEIDLPKPEIPPFKRVGFVVTEWGLIFD